MDTLRARHRRLTCELPRRGRCFIFSPRVQGYTQPPTTSTAQAEAARQTNADAAATDATANGRESTDQGGGQQIAYAEQQQAQRDLMKKKSASGSAASGDLGV